MDGEIMEALYKNPFQKHEENLEDSHEDAQETLQQDQDLGTMENNESEGFVSDLSIKEENMQEIQVSISEGDKVMTVVSNLDSDSDDQEYLVLNPMKESSAIEIVLSSLEHNLHEEVI